MASPPFSGVPGAAVPGSSVPGSPGAAPSGPASPPPPSAAVPGPAWRQRFQPWRKAAAERVQPPAVITCSGSVALAPLALSGTGAPSFENPPLAAAPGRAWQRRFQPWRRAAQARQQPPQPVTASGSIALAPLTMSGSVAIGTVLVPPLGVAAPGPSWQRVFQPWRRAPGIRVQPPQPVTCSGSITLAPLAMSGTDIVASVAAPLAAAPGVPWRRQFQPWRRAAGARVEPPQPVTASGSLTLAPLALSGTAAPSFENAPLAAAPGISWQRRFQPWRRAAGLRVQPPQPVTCSGSVTLAPLAMSGTDVVASVAEPVAATPGPSWRLQFQPWRRAAQQRQQPPSVITASGSLTLAPIAMSAAGGAIISTAPLRAAPGRAWQRRFQTWRKAAQAQASPPTPPVSSTGRLALGPLALSGSTSAASFPSIPLNVVAELELGDPAGHVQDVTAGVASTTTATAVISTTTGNTLILSIDAYIGSNTALAISSITDTAGNAWQYSTSTSSQSPPAAGAFYSGSGTYGFAAIAYCTGAAAVTSVTVTMSHSCDALNACVVEFSGLMPAATLDSCASVPVAAATGIFTAPGLSNANARDVMVAVVACDTGFSSVSAGYTLLATDSSVAWGITTSSGPAAVTFTGSSQGVEAAAVLSVGPAAGWTDITSYVLARDSETPITLHRGRPDEASQVEASSAAFELNNRDGRFTVLNPSGPYYGRVNRNTPVRFSVPSVSNYLRIEDDTTSYASTPDSAALSITGDTEIQIDLQPSGYAESFLAGKWVSGINQSWELLLNTDGTLRFFWSTTGSDTPSVGSTVPLPLGRIALKVTLAVSTGTVTFYTAPAISGPWTQLGAASSGTGGASTSVFNSTAEVEVGSSDGGGLSVNGSIYGFKLLNGIGGTVEAYADFTSQQPGATGFTDGQGNVWRLNGTAEITARDYRYHGEMSAMPTSWDPSGTDVWTPATAGGLLRRLGQGNAPVVSAFKRANLSLSGTSTPVAYWPCEDLAGSKQIASAIGGPPLQVSGAAAFAADTSFACSSAIPTVNTSIWHGLIPPYTSNGSIVIRFLLDMTSEPPDGTVLFAAYTTGTASVIDLSYHTGGGLEFSGGNFGGTVFDSGTFGFGVNGNPMWISLELTPGGAGTVDYLLATLQPGASGALATAGSYSGTVGNATSLYVNFGAEPLSAGLGHITVQSAEASLFSLAAQLDAYIGETAGNRFARLCSENGIQSRIWGYPDVSAAMGAQSPNTLTTLLQECETADTGMIVEPRQALALGYITQAALTNQAPAVTMAYSAAGLGGTGQADTLTPTYDDQYTRNDLSVQRSSQGGSSSSSGSTARYSLDDGSAMSIATPPAGVGDYTNNVSVNVEADSQLPDIAAWLVHVGTVNTYRWPVLPVNMARAEITSSQAAVQAVDIGAFIELTGPPSWLPPDPVKQIVTATTEVLGGFHWTQTFACVPESPYETGIYSDTTYGRADSDGSQLATGVTPSASTLTVATTGTSGIPWTSSGGDFPFDIGVDGERITVTGITNGAALNAAMTADSPSLWWQLADAAGSSTAADSSGNGHTGTPVSVHFASSPAAATPSGLPSALFSGVQSAVTSSYNPALSAVTVESWVNLAGRAQGGSTIVFCNSHTSVDNAGFVLFLLGGTTPEAGFGTGSASAFATATNAIGTSGWAHLAATWNGTTIVLYVNGTAAATASLSGTLAAGTANVAAGVDPANSLGYLNGYIAQCAVYPTALSAARIAAHYAAGLGQAFAVTRSVNGVVKSHPAGADVRLWTPPVYALT